MQEGLQLFASQFNLARRFEIGDVTPEQFDDGQFLVPGKKLFCVTWQGSQRRSQLVSWSQNRPVLPYQSVPDHNPTLSAFRYQEGERCLILASRILTQPNLQVGLFANQPFALAGLVVPHSQSGSSQCTILTTPASLKQQEWGITQIPIILERSAQFLWLSRRETSWQDFSWIFTPYFVDEMKSEKASLDTNEESLWDYYSEVASHIEVAEKQYTPIFKSFSEILDYLKSIKSQLHGSDHSHMQQIEDVLNEGCLPYPYLNLKSDPDFEYHLDFLKLKWRYLQGTQNLSEQQEKILHIMTTLKILLRRIRRDNACANQKQKIRFFNFCSSLGIALSQRVKTF